MGSNIRRCNIKAENTGSSKPVLGYLLRKWENSGPDRESYSRIRRYSSLMWEMVYFLVGIAGGVLGRGLLPHRSSIIHVPITSLPERWGGTLERANIEFLADAITITTFY